MGRLPTTKCTYLPTYLLGDRGTHIQFEGQQDGPAFPLQVIMGKVRSRCVRSVPDWLHLNNLLRCHYHAFPYESRSARPLQRFGVAGSAVAFRVRRPPGLRVTSGSLECPRSGAPCTWV